MFKNVNISMKVISFYNFKVSTCLPSLLTYYWNLSQVVGVIYVLLC